MVRGVLLIGHGTQDERGTREFFELACVLGQLLGSDWRVAPCLLEFQSPTIAEAWASLVDSGVEAICVTPLLLFAAGHAKSDIPDAIEQAAERHGYPRSRDESSVTFSRPLSRQAEIVLAVRARLDETFRRILADGERNDRSRIGVVMVGRGSRDPCASSDMRLLTEVTIFGTGGGRPGTLANRWNLVRDSVRTAFYAMAEPRLPDILDEVATRANCGTIIVQPHLLFAGRLYDAIVSQAEEAEKRHEHLKCVVSDYLGPTRHVAAAVASRIQNAADRD